MSTTIALGNIVGETKHLFTVAVVPLHRNFDTHQSTTRIGFGTHRKHVRVQDRLGPVDILNETFYATRKCEILFFALALIDQTNLYAIV